MKKTIISGLALFSMFFGAGNVIFPFLLGRFAGPSVGPAIFGFIIAGVFVPFLGLFAISAYGGNWHSFFGRIGRWPGFALFALLVAILGPFGSIPRLFIVSYSTLELGLSLPLFCLIACALCFFFAYSKSRVVDLLGAVLTPILLISLSIIIFGGLWNAPPLPATGPGTMASFKEGIHWGYNLLDMIAAFLYGSMILKNFQEEEGALSKMALASLIAGALLIATYLGLTLVGAHYAAEVGVTAPEGIVRAFSLHFLGTWGGLVASTTVGIACLTTAISNTAVCSTFLSNDVFKRGRLLPMGLTLGIAFVMSNLGFAGIARLIGPILSVLHPALIALCLYNIASRLRLFFQVRKLRQRSKGPSTYSLRTR